MAFNENLPLVTSLHETVEDWPKLSLTQKLGACSASIVTAAGPLSRSIIEARRSRDAVSVGETVAHLAVDLRDGLDGKIARATDGVTPFGKEFDPLADKIDFLIQELFQLHRGELPVAHVALRFSRDAIITALRSHVMAVTDGQANIGAGWYGKVSTAVRQGSLRVTGQSFERSQKDLRIIHQTAATGLLLASGAVNAKRLLDEKQKYLDTDT